MCDEKNALHNFFQFYFYATLSFWYHGISVFMSFCIPNMWQGKL